MSLRPALRPALRSAPVRAFSTSSPRRAAHQSGSSEAETEETFFNTTWINTFAILGLAFAGYKFLPAPSPGPASPSTSQENVAAAATGKTPFLTRFFASRLDGAAEVNSKRNDKHLELTIEAADTRLLFQEAEQPKVWRMKYPASFEQASPNCIGLGTQIDLSDLKVKSDEQ